MKPGLKKGFLALYIQWSPNPTISCFSESESYQFHFFAEFRISILAQSWARVLASTLTSARKPEVFHSESFACVCVCVYVMLGFCGLIWGFEFFLVIFWLGLDLLYKDYQSDQKFTITTYSSTGVVSCSVCSTKICGYHVRGLWFCVYIYLLIFCNCTSFFIGECVIMHANIDLKSMRHFNYRGFGAKRYALYFCLSDGCCYLIFLWLFRLDNSRSV